MYLILEFDDEMNTELIAKLQIQGFCQGHLGFLMRLLFGGSITTM